MNKQAKQVIRLCRRITKQVRHDDYFDATVRANFVVELEKFNSKRGYYLIVVRGTPRVNKADEVEGKGLRAKWLNVRDPSFDIEIWKMANDVLFEMHASGGARATAQTAALPLI